MYELQEHPDETAARKNGGQLIPVATLINPGGGVSHICEDDHCYVLYNGTKERGFEPVYHWYPEAVEAMKTLPAPKQVTWG